MNADIFAEWLRRQGHRVVRTQNSYWYDQGPRVYQAFPYHWVISPDEAELDEFIREHGVLALRCSTPVNAAGGAISYHIELEKKDYSLEGLSKKARYDVRKGLNEYEFESIQPARLASEGWALRLDTLRRQGRLHAETREWWQKLSMSMEGLTGFETWAAIDAQGRLCASLIAFTCDGCCSILYQQSLTECLNSGVNNALTYSFTGQTLKRPEIRSIFYGLHSLDAPPSVDQFKIRMGYTAKPVRQRVVFNPRVSPFLNPAAHGMLRAAQRIVPGSPTLSKAEGMLRFYLQGRRSLAEQHWPAPLEDQKEQVISRLAQRNEPAYSHG